MIRLGKLDRDGIALNNRDQINHNERFSMLLVSCRNSQIILQYGKSLNIGASNGIVAKNCQPFNHIFQFTYIAAPWK